jgi:tripartite-type tricarboxylate transporter receptor subunit TctC
MTMPVSRVLAALAIATGALLVPPAQAQDYPNRPIRIIVPFAPGGVADNSARVVSDKLGQRLNQQVIVENRPGASGNIGAEQVARAAPDGYTLLLGFDGTMVVNPHTFPKMPFDTVRDFAPVTKLGDATLILVAHTSVPARTVAELVAYSKTQPGGLAYGSSGTGGTPHLAAEMLKQRTGANLVHVPYKGGGQAIVDVVGGQIPLTYTAIATAQQYVRGGRLKGVATSSEKRSTSLPDVPTFIESGVSGFVVASWTGILAPAGTPKPIVDRLQKEIAAVLADPEVKARYEVLGIEPVGNTPAEFAAQIRADLARYETVVKQAGIRIE